MRVLVLLVMYASVLISEASLAAPEITDAQLRKSTEALSAATRVGGEGWMVYEQFLHPAYARWAMGEIYEGREKFIGSLEAWWNYGMRVSERNIEMVAFDMVGDVAIIRFKTTEFFVGPDGPAGGFSGYVSNTWVKEDGQWLLLSADISSTDRTD